MQRRRISCWKNKPIADKNVFVSCLKSRTSAPTPTGGAEETIIEQVRSSGSVCAAALIPLLP